jgi:hypothetical protein
LKSLMLLWKTAALELGDLCRISTSLDYQTVKVRFEHEGLSFLTIGLPAFGKDLVKGLEEGRVSSDLFVGFRRRGELPIFMGGFLDLVFDRGTGVLLDTPSTDSIFAMRQLSLMFAKISLDVSQEKKESAVEEYVRVDVEVKHAVDSTVASSRERFRNMAARLWADVFTDLDRLVYHGDVVPKHGPGATADRLRGNAKFELREWGRRLDELFPFVEYALPSLGRGSLEEGDLRLDHVDFRDPGMERPVKVVLVPKDAKRPRIIAEEPTCNQYMQQAILTTMIPRLEGEISLRSSGQRALMSPFVGFRDQTPNQRMAHDSSRDGSLATLDLSEASDRVSCQHVEDLTANFPWLRQALFATRSSTAELPDGRIITLNKFASMGSALCFPVEEMVFLTIIFLAIEQEQGHRLTRNEIHSLSGQVRAYGDDLIVPVKHAPAVIACLESFGLKVNSDKSFWNGKFRESCGKDYYDGVDVTVTRVRRVLPTSRRDAQEVISLVSLRNQMYYLGLWRTTRYLDSLVEKVISHFPTVDSSSPALGRHSIFSWKAEAVDVDTQSPVVQAWVPSSRSPVSQLDGYGALVKTLLINDGTATIAADHLERYGRPDAVYIKRRWVTPF